MNNRRSFLKNLPPLMTLSWGGIPMLLSQSTRIVRSNSRIQILDREIVFLNGPDVKAIRSVPSEFVFSQFSAIPAIPETIPVEFPWKVETTATFPERSLNGFGALNEGIYLEGQNILQIIATTPGTPDTKGGSLSYKNWYRISNDNGQTFSDFRLIVLEGNSEENSIDGVKIGRNGYTIPFTSVIFKSRRSEIMVSINLHPRSESENVELSNYKIMEHAVRDEIVIALTRRENGKWAHSPSWYRLKLN